MEKIFFDSWVSIFRTLVIGITAYVSLITLLRISGKRTLSKMNAFDLIVTIALGSTLATVLLDKNVALADGILGFTLLIFLQFIITWLSVRSKVISNIIKSTPSLLYYQGSYIDKALKDERITKDEILSKVREQGISSMEEVVAVVLETDGGMSVIRNSTPLNISTVSNVKYFNKVSE